MLEAQLPLVRDVQDLDKLECRLWWRAGEPGQKATYRAYCALHSEAQRRKDLELAAEVCIVSPILLFLLRQARHHSGGAQVTFNLWTLQ